MSLFPLISENPKPKYQNEQAPNPFWKTLSRSQSRSRTASIAHSNTHKSQAVKHVAHSNDKLKNSLSFQFVTIFPQTKKFQITQKENSQKNLIELRGLLGPLVERPVLFLQWILDLQLRRVHPTRPHKVNHQVWKKMKFEFPNHRIEKRWGFSLWVLFGNSERNCKP